MRAVKNKESPGKHKESLVKDKRLNLLEAAATQ